MPHTRARIAGLLIAAGYAALTFVLWAVVNRPTPVPPWPARIQGFAFSPFARGEDPGLQHMPSEDSIDRDLALLSGKTNAVRTYSTLGSLGAVPRLADKYEINVALGAWVDANRDTSERELEGAISLARTHRNVVRVLIGNEAVLRGDVPLEEMYAWLDRARGHPPAGRYRRAVARVAHAPGACRPRRFHRDSPAPLLGRAARRARSRVLDSAL